MLAGDAAGGLEFLRAAFAEGAAPSRERALAHYGAGLLAYRVGDSMESRLQSEAALAAADAAGDPEALALAHLGLSRLAFDDGDGARARELAEAARRHARDLEPALGQAPLHMHAQAARLEGDFHRAANSSPRVSS